MDFNFTEQETNFRNEIKNWLSNNLPKNISENNQDTKDKE